MMDLFNIPNTNAINRVFYTNGSTNSYQIWQKPKNCRFVHMLVIGGGGGGAGGAAGTGSRNGGGGGGSGALTTSFLDASLLPDVLYVQVGPGGAGGASGANGTAGSISYVSFQSNTTAINVVSYANGGALGTTLGGAGAGGGIAVQTSCYLSYLGEFEPVAGTAGSAGTSAAAGSNITFTNIICGGASGGGASASLSFSGGSINSSGFVPKIYGALNTSDSASDGFTSRPSFNVSLNSPLFFTGGAGGAGSALGAGTVGGNGAFGCGGGGGGAGSAGNAGAAGRGFILMVVLVAGKFGKNLKTVNLYQLQLSVEEVVLVVVEVQHLTPLVEEVVVVLLL